MNLDRILTFKGKRDYLHSTTVFDDILSLRQRPVGAVDFKFDRRTGRQVRYVSELPTGDVPVATWCDDAGTVYVVERDEPITRSVAYDEDGLAGQFAFSGRTVRLPAGVGPHSLIEAMVAGFKVLLKRTVAGEASRLAFVRLRLAHLPELPLEIHFTRKIGQFYQGDIHSGGAPAGQIFFGEWH